MLDDNILSHYGKQEYWEDRYARYIYKTLLYNELYIIIKIEDQSLLIGIKYIPDSKILYHQAYQKLIK